MTVYVVMYTDYDSGSVRYIGSTYQKALDYVTSRSKHLQPYLSIEPMEVDA